MKKEISLAHKIEVKVRKQRAVKNENCEFEPEVYEGGHKDIYDVARPKKTSKKSKVIKNIELKTPKVMKKAKTTKNLTKTDNVEVNETNTKQKATSTNKV